MLYDNADHISQNRSRNTWNFASPTTFTGYNTFIFFCSGPCRRPFLESVSALTEVLRNGFINRSLQKNHISSFEESVYYLKMIKTCRLRYNIKLSQNEVIFLMCRNFFRGKTRVEVFYLLLLVNVKVKSVKKRYTTEQLVEK